MSHDTPVELTFDDMYHDVSRLGVVRQTRVIRAMRELHLLHDEHGAVFLKLESNAGLVVVVYHARLAIPEHVAGRFCGRHQLALQTQTGSLLHVEIRPTRYHRVRLRDVQPHESLLHRCRLNLFYWNTAGWELWFILYYSLNIYYIYVSRYVIIRKHEKK